MEMVELHSPAERTEVLPILRELYPSLDEGRITQTQCPCRYLSVARGLLTRGNFGGLRYDEVRRIFLLRGWVNRAYKEDRSPHTLGPHHQVCLLAGEPLVDALGDPRPLGDLGGLLPDLSQL